MTELAALPLASYFFQLFGAFAPWRAIFAADLLDVYKRQPARSIPSATLRTS